MPMTDWREFDQCPEALLPNEHGEVGDDDDGEDFPNGDDDGDGD